MTVLDVLKDHWYSATIMLPDKEYHKPTRKEIEWLLFESGFESYKYLKDTFDCDDFALVLHAFVRQEQYKRKWKEPWAFGEAWGKFKYQEGRSRHALNISVLDTDEVLLIEPQSDRTWVANNNVDRPGFIRM